MSTTTTAPTTGAVAASKDVNSKATKATSELNKDQKLRNLAKKAEAERVKNLAIQLKKSLATERKVNKELASKGKLAILQDRPSRPARHPIKKGRKPLAPPANKNHDKSYAVAHAKGVCTMRAMARRPHHPPSKWNYTSIVEQRVVDGNVEQIPEPACVLEIVDTRSDDDSVYDSISNSEFDSNDNIPSFPGPIPTPADGWGFVEELGDGPSPEMSSSESSEADIDVNSQLKNNSRIRTSLPRMMTLNSQFLSPLPGDRFLSLFTLPDADIIKNFSKADKKAEKATKVVDAVTGVASSTASDIANSNALEKSDFVSKLLSMPNGPGTTEEALALHEKMVVMHVSALQLPVSKQQQQQQQKKPAEILIAEIYEPDFVFKMLSIANGPGVTGEARTLHEKLVAMFVPVLEFPVSKKQQKKSDAVSTADTYKSGSVTKFLSMPNGSGATMESRNSHEKLVAMHVPALQFSAGKQEEANPVMVEPVAIAKLDSTTDDPTPVKETTELEITTPTSPKEATKSINEQGRFFTSQKPIPVSANDNTPASWHVSSPIRSTPNQSFSNSSVPASLSISHTSHPSSGTQSSRNSSIRSSTDSSSTSSSLQLKAEVARTTFLGTTSLATFVQTLDFELVNGTTTKDDICAAFACLSGYAAITTDLETPKVQRKIKLGGTSLYGFLNMVTFDEEDVASLNGVMQAFKRAADEVRDRGMRAVEIWDAQHAQHEHEELRGRTATREA
ncbi:hypothetical protein DDE83_006345 [Stemphylium lycopersici]|uniref:Uncharacterized protein n=1 Tax=Stemphylium lycopersici TaxID=183478 RepID=A0A364MZP9_STELY|nr:hypothetical protein DDE83_006345 [Stemphylium lycopersici]